MINGVDCNASLLKSLLGISGVIPINLGEMANSLEVVFYPQHERSPVLDKFADNLRVALIDAGATVVSIAESIIPDSNDKIRPGVVVIEQGYGKTMHRLYNALRASTRMCL